MDLPVVSNPDAERAVIGAMLVDNRRFVDAEMLQPEDFAVPAHQAIWAAMRKVHEAGGFLDAVTVRHRIGPSNKPAIEALRVAEESALSVAGLAAHVAIVRSMAARRALVRTASELLEAASDELLELPVVQDLAEAAYMRGLMAMRQTDQAIEIHTALGAALRDVRAEANQATPRGIAFGLREVDLKTGGMRLGHVTILAGKTGRGKSALGWQVAAAAAVRGIGVLGFPLEMDAADIARRLIAAALKHDTRDLARVLDDRQRDVLAYAQSLQGGGWFGMFEDTELTVTQVRSRARVAKAEHPELALVVVDYLQLLDPAPGRYQSREREVASISKGLRGLAKELGVAVLALSQFNRKSDEENRRPKLSDLRESGAVEQDAALVAMIHEPDPTAPWRPEGREYELVVAKNRFGRGTGFLPLVFRPEWTSFEEGTLPAKEATGEEKPKRPVGRPRKHPKPDQLGLDAIPPPSDDDAPPPKDED